MKVKTLLLISLAFSMISCKTIIRCNAAELEEASDREDVIRNTGRKILEAYYTSENNDDSTICHLTNIAITNITTINKNDAQLSVVISGKYRKQGTADTTWHNLQKDTAMWMYHEKDKMATMEPLKK